MIRADDSVGLQTRRCFLSVMAAEKAAQRATECGESAKNVHGGSESGPVPERSRPGRCPTRARARTRACPPTLVGEVLVAPCRSSRRQTAQHPGRCWGRSATRLAVSTSVAPTTCGSAAPTWQRCSTTMATSTQPRSRQSLRRCLTAGRRLVSPTARGSSRTTLGSCAGMASAGWNGVLRRRKKWTRRLSRRIVNKGCGRVSKRPTCTAMRPYR